MMLMKNYLDIIEYAMIDGGSIDICFAQFMMVSGLLIFAAMILHHTLQQPRLYIIPSYKSLLRSYWKFLKYFWMSVSIYALSFYYLGDFITIQSFLLLLYSLLLTLYYAFYSLAFGFGIIFRTLLKMHRS